MGYTLLDNRNPHGSHFYTSRSKGVTAIVLHITAGLEDLDLRGVDHSAEATARYASNTSVKVSWHAGVDSDSIVRLLPDHYTAWHCKGMNSGGLGLEISKTHTDWRTVPRDWVRATLANAAVVCSEWSEKFKIPQRLLTRAQAVRGVKGFVYHSTMDPTRRSDPGANFPIELLWRLMNNEEDEVTKNDIKAITNSLLEALADPDNQRAERARLEIAKAGWFRLEGRVNGVSDPSPEVIPPWLAVQRGAQIIAREHGRWQHSD